MKIKFYQRILILPVLVFLCSALVPYVARGQDSIVISEIKLTSSVAEPKGEKFGSSVAIEGNTIGVGAILADGGAQTSGAAYLFKITDGTDLPQTKLVGNGDAKLGDHFGNSLDISGDALVIGAEWMDDGNIGNSGSAFVVRSSYDETTETWTITEQTKLTASEPSSQDEFGRSVAISGNTVVVGARQDNAVYVFNYDGSGWVRKAKLEAMDAQGGELFGSSVAIEGDTLVVGATRGGEADAKSGSAYVFEYNGSDWEEVTELFVDDLAYNDQFGYSVAIEDDTIIVGAPRHDGGVTDSGAAYVFRFNGTTWIPKQKLIGSDLFEKAYFGHSVALSGNTAVFGAYRNDVLDADDNPIKDVGSAHVFRFGESGWVEKEILIAADAEANDEFGWSVAISGHTVVVGAHKDDNLAGSAYVYTLNQPPVAIVGEDKEVEEGSVVTLMGSDSYDLDGGNLTYDWTQSGGQDVSLEYPYLANPTFTAPACSAGNEILTFELVVNDGSEDSDPAEVRITVLPSTKKVSEITSVLGSRNHRRGIGWNTYIFDGTKGERVTVTLRAKLGGKNNGGNRATLKLKDNIRGISFFRIDSGRLPNQICATLPATGQYRVIVAGLPRLFGGGSKFFGGRGFSGEYTITLEGASACLERGAGSTVVHKKSKCPTKPRKQHPIWSWFSSRFKR